jgi:tetratricopeptide (TPR) repeat protein
VFTALGLAERAAQTHLALGYVFDCRNEDRAALRESRLALADYRHLQHPAGQAVALNNVGWSLGKLGHPGLGIGACRKSLALNQSNGDVQGQAGAWDSLGYLHGLLGNLDESIACYDRAAQLYRAVRGRRDEAGSLQRLGDAYHAAGRSEEAAGVWQRALSLYERLNHPEADAIRRLLGHPSAGLPAPPSRRTARVGCKFTVGPVTRTDVSWSAPRPGRGSADRDARRALRGRPRCILPCSFVRSGSHGCACPRGDRPSVAGSGGADFLPGDAVGVEDVQVSADPADQRGGYGLEPGSRSRVTVWTVDGRIDGAGVRPRGAAR